MCSLIYNFFIVCKFLSPLHHSVTSFHLRVRGIQRHVVCQIDNQAGLSPLLGVVVLQVSSSSTSPHRSKSLRPCSRHIGSTEIICINFNTRQSSSECGYDDSSGSACLHRADGVIARKSEDAWDGNICRCNDEPRRRNSQASHDYGQRRASDLSRYASDDSHRPSSPRRNATFHDRPVRQPPLSHACLWVGDGEGHGSGAGTRCKLDRRRSQRGHLHQWGNGK